MKFKSIITCLALVLLFSSCGKNEDIPDEPKPSDDPVQGEAAEDTRIFGTVISVSHNSRGLAELLILTENGSVCSVSPNSYSYDSSLLGSDVVVTADGSVLEADPLQAVAESIDVTAEFNCLPLDVEIYSLYEVVASKVSEALTSKGYNFYRFKTFDECLDFLEVNDLYREFNETVGDTDITALTDEFFEANDLCAFVVNGVENNGNVPTEVYLNDGKLYLSIRQTTENAPFVNTSFDVFLLPLAKDSEVDEGIVLTEKYLQPSL